MGRPKRLSLEQQLELSVLLGERRRIERELSYKVLAVRFGLARKTVGTYAARLRRQMRKRA